MADKAKFAYGSLANLDAALQSGAVDAFDLLCLYDDGVARIGWVNKNGEPVLVDVPSDDVLVVDELPETGKTGVIYIVGEIVYIWSGTQFIVISESTDISDVKDRLASLEELVSALEAKDVAFEEKDVALEAGIAALKGKDAAIEAEVAKKADAEQVATDIEQAEADAIASANAYADKLAKEVVALHVSKKYEIAKAPEGTLVDYFDKEIRIMIPKTTDFANLNNAIAGAEDMRYIECHIYAPEGAVRHRFDFGGEIQEGTVEAFSGCTDEHGRIYIANVPPIASYDAATDTWVYYGANSTVKHYVGWNLTAEWFDENDVVIASDSIRINLSNEDCHYSIEPYYVGEMTAEIKAYTDAQIEAKIEEVSEIPVVEF